MRFTETFFERTTYRSNETDPHTIIGFLRRIDIALCLLISILTSLKISFVTRIIVRYGRAKGPRALCHEWMNCLVWKL